MKKGTTLYTDQHGNKFYASTVEDLRSQIGMGNSQVSGMYIDKEYGRIVRIGYVIGGHWLEAYTRLEKPVK